MPATSPTAQGGLRAWQLFLVVGLAGASVATALARDTRVSNLVMASIAVCATIVVGVAFHRTLQPFGADRPDEEATVLSARARAALEREKMMVLRTIKELEFDKAMGKIAEGDFQEMAGRLRVRAIGIMKQLDIEASGYRGLIERDLRARLEAAGAGVATAPAPTAAPQVSDAPVPASLACAACGTTNDQDARFCKKCGAKLDAFAVSV